MKWKKIIIIVSLLVFVAVTPIISYQLFRIIKRDSLCDGTYIIESVNCTAALSDPITLMVKPSLNTSYELFPEVINPMENITYIDNITNYSCFVKRGSYESAYFYKLKLDIKVVQNSNSQKLTYEAVLVHDVHKWNQSFIFDKLGIELLITFRLDSVAKS